MCMIKKLMHSQGNTCFFQACRVKESAYKGAFECQRKTLSLTNQLLLRSQQYLGLSVFLTFHLINVNDLPQSTAPNLSRQKRKIASLTNPLEWNEIQIYK